MINLSNVMRIYCGDCKNFLGYLFKGFPMSLTCNDCKLRFDYNGRLHAFTATSLHPKISIKDVPVAVLESPRFNKANTFSHGQIPLIAISAMNATGQANLIDGVLNKISSVKEFECFIKNNESIGSQAKYIFQNDPAIRKEFKTENCFLAFYKRDIKSRIKVCSG